MLSWSEIKVVFSIDQEMSVRVNPYTDLRAAFRQKNGSRKQNALRTLRSLWVDRTAWKPIRGYDTCCSDKFHLQCSVFHRSQNSEVIVDAEKQSWRIWPQSVEQRITWQPKGVTSWKKIANTNKFIVSVLIRLYITF